MISPETILGTILGFLGTLVGTVVWAIRLEGRVNAAEVRATDLKELIESKFDDLDTRLDRMERSMNGHTTHRGQPK
jgi:hypothetical protein